MPPANMAAMARSRSGRELRHAGDSVTAGAAASDAGAEEHQEAADEGHGRAHRQAPDAGNPLPDWRDGLSSRSRQPHGQECAERNAADHRDLPPVLRARLWLEKYLMLAAEKGSTSAAR